MSRICHPSEKTWSILQHIITRVLVNFPSHALWSLMAAYKSTQQDRRQRGMKLIEMLKVCYHLCHYNNSCLKTDYNRQIRENLANPTSSHCWERLKSL